MSLRSRLYVTVLCLVVVASLLALGVSAARKEAASRRINNSVSANVVGPPVPTITATLADDITLAQKKNPGGTITYTAVITNSGTDATGVVFNHTLNGGTTVLGSPVVSPLAAGETYQSIGNMTLNTANLGANCGANSLSNVICNDTLNGATLVGFGATQGTANGTVVNGTNTVTTSNGGTITLNTNGTFTYNPAAGFEGTDSFWYTLLNNTVTPNLTDNAQVSITVGGVNGIVWFINNGAAACTLLTSNCGRQANPFSTLASFNGFNTGAGNNPASGDTIFLFENASAYTGPVTLLANQKLIGQDATASVPTLGGPALPTNAGSTAGNAYPAINPSGTTVSISGGATGVGLNSGNNLAGFTVSGTTVAVTGGAVGNLSVREVTINSAGAGLIISTSGTFVNNATFTGFAGITSTGGTNGISLTGVAGTLAIGSTTVSGSTTQGILVQQSTANINFGNTVVGTGVAGTGGTNGVALLNNSAGTRTFGTLTIQNNNGPSNSAFLSATGGGGTGGGNAVVGTTNILNVPGTGNGIDIQSLATGTSVSFGATTVNKASPGSLVNLVSNVGNVSFLSLGGTNTNGAALTGTENTGSITVTNNTGSLTATLGPVLSITKAGAPATPITLNFTALSSTNSGTQGVNLDRVSGNLTATTTTVNNSTGTGIQVQNTVTGGTMNFGTTSVAGTGNANVDAAGMGVFLNANAGNVTFSDLDISPDANERAFQSTNMTGTITTASGDIAATGNVTLEIVGLSLVSRTPLAMTLNNLDSTNSNGVGVNINFVSGNFTVNDATLATSIQNPTGVGLQVQNTAAGGTMNFGNTQINGSGGIGASLGTAANGNAGNITFADLDITPDANQRGFVAIDNTGTLTVSTGDITTSGSNTANAIFIDGPAGRTPINLTFTSISTTSTAEAIRLVDVSGTKFQVTGTTQLTTRVSGAGGFAAAQYAGVFVDNATTSTIQFATVTIPNPNAAGGHGFRVSNSSSAVTIASSTISDANVTLAQTDGNADGLPDTDGDGDAIFLKNNTGSLTLNGGTLSNCGNDCIDLRSSSALVLSNVNITMPGVDGGGMGASGAGGHGIFANNLTGTSSVTGGTISGFNQPSRDGFQLRNSVSTPLTLTVQNATFQNSTGNRGFAPMGYDTANMTVTVTNCTFSNISGVALQQFAGGGAGSTATMNFTVQNSTFQNSSTDGKTNLLTGVLEAAKANIQILNNTFNNVFITASTGEPLIGVGNDGLLAGNQLDATVSGNTINGIGSAASNCAGGAVRCNGPFMAISVFIDDQASQPNTIVIDNNTITNVQQGGINLDMANAGANASNVTAKITNNCVGRLRVAGACTGADARVGVGAGASVFSGIRVERRRAGAKTANVLVSGNTVRAGNGTNQGTLNTPGLFARTQADTTMNITVTSNNVDTTMVGAAEMRFITNSPVVGDPTTQTMCVDVTGNTLVGAATEIRFDENVGTLNVEQASSAAVSAGNGGAPVTIAAGSPSFGVVCATPPAAADIIAATNSDAPGEIPNASAVAVDYIPIFGALVTAASWIRSSQQQVESHAFDGNEAVTAFIPAGDELNSRGQPRFAWQEIFETEKVDSLRLVQGNDLDSVRHPAASSPATESHAFDVPSGEVANSNNFKSHHGRNLGLGIQALLQRGVNAVARLAAATHSLIEPSASAAEVTPNSINPPSGELVNVNVGNLPAGKSITIVYQATVNIPPPGAAVSTQGNVTFTGGPGGGINTDDPETGTGGDATVTNINTTCTWDGDTSTDWNAAGNWDFGYVPLSFSDVVIPNVGNQPSLTLGSDATINSLNVANGRTITVAGDHTITISAGNLTLDGIISGGTLRFGAGTHAINNAGGTGSLSSTNIMVMLTGANVTLNHNLQAGAVNINAGGTFNITNRTLTLVGPGAALTASGTFTVTGSTVVLAGTTGAQTTGTVYNNLTINNNAGVTLAADSTVNGLLTLTNGIFNTSTFTLTMGAAATRARTNGYISGNEKKTFGGAGAFIFDVGTANGYSPVDVNVTAGAGDLTVKATQGPQPNVNAATSLQRYWTLTEGGTGIAANVVFHYLDPTDLMGNEAAYRIIRVSGGTPVSFQNNCPSPCVDPATNTGTINGVANFSDWTLGEPIAPTATNGVISGQIVDTQGHAVEGVAIRMNGTQTRLTVTDATGNYRFDNVEINGLYVITPSRVNFSFGPTQRSFTQLGLQTDAAFTAAANGGTLNPLDTTEYFVRQQYVDFLGREPDESGFNFWVNNIESCGADVGCREVKRIDTSAAFFLSIEFQQTGYIVYRTYKSAYNDLPNTPVPLTLAEFRPDTAQISNGVIVLQDGWQDKLESNKQAFMTDFVQRSRFVNEYPLSLTPSAFVTKLFSNAGVSTSEADYAAAVSEFGGAADTANTAARARALRRIAENATLDHLVFNRAFVLMEYFGYLRRDPNSGQDSDFAGYNFWLDKLNDFNGNFRDAQMVKAFLTSIEYRDRFPR